MGDVISGVDVRKACKMVMESEVVLSTTYKTRIKNFRIFDHEEIGLKKLLNVFLIVYDIVRMCGPNSPPFSALPGIRQAPFC